ncbi:MAG: GNAT family N-acetyltransferase [Acidimicrobiia bacterium]
MSEHGEHPALLRDGTTVTVRPIRPEDKEALAAGLSRVSPESRYRRFLRPVTSLSPKELAYLTEIDYSNHFAWVAVDPDDDQHGLGVARYVRDAKDPTIAEAAVIVVDDYQSKGLGTILLRLLVATALDNGITTFRGWVLGDNVEILRPLERLGALRRADKGVLRIEVDLNAAFDGSSIQDALRAVAAGEFTPEPGA